MAALSFTVLLCFVILATGAGSRPSPDDQAVLVPLRSSNDAAGSYDYSYRCVYTIYVETGSIWKAGTDADQPGSRGRRQLMGAGHDYYERGNVDVFSGQGPCLSSPPCRMNLTSDGSGPHHGWHCKIVEVTATGHHASCAKAGFGVEQWLASDAPPYHLYAERSVCAKSEAEE